MKAALALIPITKPVYAQYRAWRENRYPHWSQAPASAARCPGTPSRA